MAKATLPVNFKDDVLNSKMSGKRRYTITQNSDGTYCIEDASTYDQIGSNFGSAQVNATNTAVNAAADAGKIIDSLPTIASNTQSGYMAGALAVKELNQSLTTVNNRSFPSVQIMTETGKTNINLVCAILDLGYYPLLIIADGEMTVVNITPDGVTYSIGSSGVKTNNILSIGASYLQGVTAVKQNTTLRIKFQIKMAGIPVTIIQLRPGVNYINDCSLATS